MAHRARVAFAAAAIVLLGACGSAGGSHASAPSSRTASDPASAPSSAVRQPVTTAPVTSDPATASGRERPPSTAASAPHTATRQVTLRPVTAAGTVAPGYSLRAGTVRIDCSSGQPSPVATSGAVLYCQPSAAAAIACWQAADRTHAYCLTDARATTVTEYPLRGRFGSPRPAETEPVPMAMDLADGTRCAVRVGGAAARLAAHPDWVPYYYCGRGDVSAVWAAPYDPHGGILTGDGPWEVRLGSAGGTGSLRTLTVRTAYFVATAA